MADNLTLNAGSGGSTLATDDDATAHHQYVKVEFGADNTQTKVADTASAQLPVGGSGATALGKATDSAAGATDTGVPPLAVRDDSLTTLTPVDGDYTPLRVNSTGALHVTGGGGGTEYNEDDATPNPIVGAAALMERDDALSALTPAEGDFAGQRCTSTGAMWTEDVNTGAIKTAVETIDNPVSGNEMLIAGGATQTNDMKVTLDSEAVVLGAGSAGIGKLTANSGVDIGDVDVTSIVPGAGATNLGKAEDVAHSTGDVGVAAMTVRANAAVSLSGADNDYQPLITDTNGRLHTNDVSTAAALSGSQFQVDVVAALPAGTNEIGKLAAGTAAIGKLAANSGVDIGDVTLTAGTAAIGKLVANSGVDFGDVDVTSVIPGAGATNLGKAEDAAHATGDVGVAAMTVRANAATALSGADNDYQPLISDTNGRLHTNDASTTAALSGNEFQVDVVAALPSGTNGIGKLTANSGVDIGDVDVTSIVPGVGTTNLGKAEDVAHGTGDVGVMALAVRKATPADVSNADGDYEPLQMDNGRLWTSTALEAGTNAIGKLAANSGVDIGDVTLTAGTAAIGKLAANSGVDIGDVTLTAGTNAIGKLAANSGVDIGDVDVTSQPALDRATDNVGAAQCIDKVMNDTTELTVVRAQVTPATSGVTAVIAAKVSTAFVVHSLVLLSASDTINNVYFLENAGASLFGDSTEKISIERDGGGAAGGLVLNHNPLGWFRTTTANKALDINLSAAQGLICMVTYSEIAA